MSKSGVDWWFIGKKKSTSEFDQNFNENDIIKKQVQQSFRKL